MKKKILLVWWYNRNDLWKPFEAIMDSFDYSFLFYKYPEEDNGDFPYTAHYWSEFSSAEDILKKIRPHKVVFFGVVSHYTIALNYICKKNGVPTYQVEHGVRATLSEALKLEKVEFNPSKTIKVVEKSLSSKLHPLLFYLRTFTVGDLGVVSKFLKIFYLLRKYPRYKALSTLPFAERRPDKYIVFTEWLGEIYIERDGALKQELVPIGNYFFDEYFKKHKGGREEETSEKYYLLIDQPVYDIFEEIETGDRTVFYQKLANFALQNQAKLYIKLHPADYQRADLPEIANALYIKDADNVALLNKSTGCFGFFSTLLIPAIYQKPTVLFKIKSLQMVEDWKNIGIIDLLDFFKFQSIDIDFQKLANRQDSKSEFIEKYLYKADGQALTRLKQELAA